MDAETLTALLQSRHGSSGVAAATLLAGGYLTLYQMALIEAGNLDGLVLGPVRLVDRLRSGPREPVYRVFDPRPRGDPPPPGRGRMHDAVRPDDSGSASRRGGGAPPRTWRRLTRRMEIDGRPAG